MHLPRRRFLHLVAGAAALPAVSRLAREQAYPTRPVTIIVGFPVGGGIDLDARLMAQWLSDRLGQPFNVENRIGSGSAVATEAVVRAPADGYTLLLANAANAINATLSSFRVKTAPELIAYAKANPGKITMAPPFSVCAAVAPTKLEDLKERDEQPEPLRAEQRKALEKHGCGLSARSIRSATSGANSINKSST